MMRDGPPSLLSSMRCAIELQQHAVCGTRILNKLAPETQYHLKMARARPLGLGQRVEVGIIKGSLQRSAFLVYMLPLLWYICGAAILQSTLGSAPLAAYGGMAAGVAGFLCACYLARHSYDTHNNQLVILAGGAAASVSVCPGLMPHPPSMTSYASLHNTHIKAKN